MAYPSMVKTYAQTKYNVSRCAADRRGAKAVKYVVVHYTGTSASAKNNCIYFGGGNRNASADYFVDADGTIYKFNADCANYYSWHCGDGAGKYGITNANSIGVECVSAGNEFTAKQRASLKALVCAIMADYGVSAANVVRHYDASRKLCPLPYCGSAAKDKKWAALRKEATTVAAEGWVKNGKGWWWRNADGTWPKSCWKKINGKWYWFEGTGYIVQSCCKQVNGKWYAFASSGAMLEGSVKLNSGGDMKL